MYTSCKKEPTKNAHTRDVDTIRSQKSLGSLLFRRKMWAGAQLDGRPSCRFNGPWPTNSRIECEWHIVANRKCYLSLRLRFGAFSVICLGFRITGIVVKDYIDLRQHISYSNWFSAIPIVASGLTERAHLKLVGQRQRRIDHMHHKINTYQLYIVAGFSSSTNRAGTGQTITFHDQP